MAVGFFGHAVSEEMLAELCECDPFYGAHFDALCEAAATLGLSIDQIDPATALSDVRSALDAGRPVIALVDPSSLYGIDTDAGHYVVILNMDDEAVTLHDSALGPKLTISATRFRVAWAQYEFLGVAICS